MVRGIVLAHVLVDRALGEAVCTKAQGFVQILQRLVNGTSRISFIQERTHRRALHLHSPGNVSTDDLRTSRSLGLVSCYRRGPGGNFSLSQAVGAHKCLAVPIPGQYRESRLPPSQAVGLCRSVRGSGNQSSRRFSFGKRLSIHLTIALASPWAFFATPRLTRVPVRPTQLATATTRP